MPTRRDLPMVLLAGWVVAAPALAQAWTEPPVSFRERVCGSDAIYLVRIERCSQERQSFVVVESWASVATDRLVFSSQQCVDLEICCSSCTHEACPAEMSGLLFVADGRRPDLPRVLAEWPVVPWEGGGVAWDPQVRGLRWPRVASLGLVRSSLDRLEQTCVRRLRRPRREPLRIIGCAAAGAIGAVLLRLGWRNTSFARRNRRLAAARHERGKK
jgi:hypothetical protein